MEYRFHTPCRPLLVYRGRTPLDGAGVVIRTHHLCGVSSRRIFRSPVVDMRVRVTDSVSRVRTVLALFGKWKDRLPGSCRYLVLRNDWARNPPTSSWIPDAGSRTAAPPTRPNPE